MKNFLRERLMEGAGGDAGGGAPAPSAAPEGGAPAAAPEGGAPAAAPEGGTPAAAPEPAANPFATPTDGWRGHLVSAAGFEGDDATRVGGMLERVSDFGVLVKNYVSAQDKIRNGELSTGLPENPSEEQLASYRSANGIPATPADYSIDLGEGVIIGDDDQRILDEVYKVGHASNVSNEVMTGLVGTFLAGRNAEVEEMQQQDGIQKQQASQQLKTAWGADFEANRNMVAGLVAKIPETVREDFEGARLADGRALFNSPEMMVFLSDVARQLNPAGTVVPNANNPVQAINDEIKSLEARMGTAEWSKDTEAQARYMSLIDAQNQMEQQP